VHRFFWRGGAVPAVIREWADHLEAAGHEVEVLASDVRPAESTGRRAYMAVGLGRRKAFDLGGLVFAARLAPELWRRRRTRPDVILSLDSTAYFGVWLAGKLLRVPTIMVFQGWIYSPGKRGIYGTTVTWVYKLAVHFCVRWAPLVGCLSQEIHRGLRALGAPPERLWLAPNCVDRAVWRTDKAGAHQRSTREVLYVGGLRTEKGIDYLMAALPTVVRRLPQVRFRVVGGAEGEDGKYHDMARRLGVLDRVVFGGLVPREALPEVYGAADIMVAPSLAEGHALAPLECLASGTPVIASDIPGLQGTVQDGVNGLVVPARDSAALAGAICRALSDEALLDRMTRAARPSVERFSWKHRIREFEAISAGLRRRRGSHG